MDDNELKYWEMYNADDYIPDVDYGRRFFEPLQFFDAPRSIVSFSSQANRLQLSNSLPSPKILPELSKDDVDSTNKLFGADFLSSISSLNNPSLQSNGPHAQSSNLVPNKTSVVSKQKISKAYSDAKSLGDHHLSTGVDPFALESRLNFLKDSIDQLNRLSESS
ncbi:hypothetical protein AYI68_g980 [Smittium mucronatum]|uniref:Uncharacterized protein n=1 Tax=Smittium mucronatum TaxID=133383 RepID=A0A1R0H6Z1_9FUNG|nr:hypothetical protein AYI68_g980 [Smittium mucronatum]